MYNESHLLKKTSTIKKQKNFVLLPLPENPTESEEHVYSALNTVFEKVYKQIHRNDLEKGLNGNVVERFMLNTMGYQTYYQRLNTLNTLQESKKPLISCTDESEPVS